jgi:hypothetical protein
MLGIGITLLACLTLYLLPRTSALGALLLTGYLGGAVATHVRVGNPLFSHVLFPTYVAALIWGGLILRRPELRVMWGRGKGEGRRGREKGKAVGRRGAATAYLIAVANV